MPDNFPNPQYRSNYYSPSEQPAFQPVQPANPNYQPMNYQQVKPKSNPLKTLFSWISGLLILCLILMSGAFIYILANPKDSRSQWLVQNTPLNKIIDLPQDDSSNSSTKDDKKIINNIISGGNNSGAGLEFTNSAGAKTTVQVVEQALPSVLSISLKSTDKESGLGQELTAGTGYVVSKDGLIVSNRHVVSVVCKNSDKIDIIGLNHAQKVYSLKLMSVDPIDDIAILKAEQPDEGLVPLQVANSDELRLGQDVLAIGNVLGELQNTVTKGIVSGLNRSFETELKDDCTGGSFKADGLIQTDAAINKGNSGGPLFNASGQLVGMNTLGTVDAQNIGLAIPSVTIKIALESFLANQRIVRARLGVNSIQVNSLRKAQNSWIPTDYGEIVYAKDGEAISSGSAAARSGIKEGDIILEVDGEKLITTGDNPSPLRRAVLKKQAGQEVVFQVLRSNGSSQNGFKYEKNPTQIKVALGSVSFDLSNKKIDVS